MSEWKEYRLGDICEIFAGGDAPKGRFSKIKTSVYNVPIYSNGITDEGLYGYTDKARVFVPASTITARGTIGVVFRRKEPYFPIVRLITVIGSINVLDSDFLYYCLRNTYIDGEGSVQSQLTVPMISNYRINIPSLPIQKRIASILSSLDSKIECNRNICANLEVQAQALFKHWFIDFAPFKDGKFVESELGRIPEGWRVGRLGEIAEISSGKRPNKRYDTETEDHNVPLIGASCVMGYTSEAFTSKKILLTGRVGTLGIIQRSNSACWPSDNTLVLTTQFYEFVYQILKTLNYSGMNRGTSQPLITQGDLKKTSIIIPPDEIINEFEDVTSELMSHFEYNSRESKKLSTLRDTLLPKLMSGQIKL